jgi:hypothetical protein
LIEMAEIEQHLLTVYVNYIEFLFSVINGLTLDLHR